MNTSDSDKSGLFQIEGVLRAHATPIQLLELDGILVNREISDAERTAQAHHFIEKFVERVSHGDK